MNSKPKKNFFVEDTNPERGNRLESMSVCKKDWSL